MANTLIIGADNLITIDKLMVPNSDPPQYIDSGTITWQLLDQSNNILATGSYSYVGGSEGEWQTVISNTVSSALTANNQYTLKSSVTATGFVSLFKDTYLAVEPQSAQFSYCVRKDLENIYGANNITKWADIDNDGVSTKIDARINWALVLSYDYLNNKLSGGPYTIPLTGRYPTIINAQAQLASVQLYESRGLTNYTEDDKPIHQLQQGKDWANNIIGQIRAGILRLHTALPQDISGTIVPQSIRSTRCRPYYGWPYNYSLF